MRRFLNNDKEIDEIIYKEEIKEEAKKGVRFKNRLRIKDISNLM